MRKILAFAALCAATGALAEEKYTNADLDRIYVPGAYTNEDLKALPPLEVQEAPAMTLVAPRVDTTERDRLLARMQKLEAQRDALARELAYVEEQVRRSESAGGNSPGSSYFAGYRGKSRGLREALRKEIALLGHEIDETRWHAVRASVVTFP